MSTFARPSSLRSGPESANASTPIAVARADAPVPTDARSAAITKAAALKTMTSRDAFTCDSRPNGIESSVDAGEWT